MDEEKLKKLAAIAKEVRAKYPQLFEAKTASGDFYTALRNILEKEATNGAAAASGLRELLKAKGIPFGLGALAGGLAGGLGTYLAMRRKPKEEEIAYYLWPYLM